MNNIQQKFNFLLSQLQLREEIEDLLKKGLTQEEILGYIEFADKIVEELLEGTTEPRN